MQHKSKDQIKQERKELSERTDQVLRALPKREELTLRLRFGFDGGVMHTYREIADAIGYSISSVWRFEQQALRRLRDPDPRLIPKSPAVPEPRIQEVSFVVEKVKKLTPELIQHLKSNKSDLNRIHWEVFQHLVGEFLKTRGFDDVRLVGRNPLTSADLYASHLMSPVGIIVRVFVEVKRTSEKLGIEVINEVAGAMLTEKPSIGWHAALIVSTARFRDFRKFNPYELSLRGIELKNRNDLLKWLEEYEPNERGLWLPRPKTALPEGP